MRWRKILAALVILILAMVVLLAHREATAHHKPAHMQFAIGVPTVMPLGVLACDSAAHLERVHDAWREHGYRAALRELMALRYELNARGEPSCGIVYSMSILIDRIVIGPEALPGYHDPGEAVTVTSFHFHTIEGREYYGQFVGVEILPADRAGELGAEGA